MSSSDVFDVAIIGAGIAGTAIARHISGSQASIVVIDSANDVGLGASGVDPGIWHSGFDTMPGSPVSVLVKRGYQLLQEYAFRANIPIEKTGSIAVAWDESEMDMLSEMERRAHLNGYSNARMLSGQEVLDIEYALSTSAIAGLEIPDDGLVCPWTTAFAFAQQARTNDVEFVMNSSVIDVTRRPDLFWQISLSTGQEVVAKYVVNAAGVFSDDIDAMFDHSDFYVLPTKATYLTFDKLARPLFSHVVTSVQGVVQRPNISPNIYGNISLGPFFTDAKDKTDHAVESDNVEAMVSIGEVMSPRLMEFELTSMHAGNIPVTNISDIHIREHPAQRYISVGSLGSRGLTVSMAVAEQVSGMLKEMGFASERPLSSTIPVMPNIGEHFIRPYQRQESVQSSASFGDIVCFCERVTRAEIEDAITGALPAQDIRGVMRRTRATMGRCQGTLCSARVREILDSSI